MMRTPVLIALLPFISGCVTAPYSGPRSPVRYTGSSTIAQFVSDVQKRFPGSTFLVDTAGESSAGEKAILEGKTDIAGVANRPKAVTLRAGVASAIIGRDAIAVIVHKDVAVENISLPDLQGIFTGEIRNWKKLSGRDQPIQPFIVDASSATHGVFRGAALQGADYAGCTIVKPDSAIIERVANSPGAIGQISFSFLEAGTSVKTVAVDGEWPSVANFSYPIARPLYLLWREGNPDVESFVDWTLSSAGQRVVMTRFVATRVVGVTPKTRKGSPMGYLVVNTETYPVYDGGIHYYPHRSYDLLTRYGKLIRRVRNHRSENDERPMKIALAPGTYLVRPHPPGSSKEFFVNIKASATTEVDAPEKQREQE